MRRPFLLLSLTFALLACQGESAAQGPEKGKPGAARSEPQRPPSLPVGVVSVIPPGGEAILVEVEFARTPESQTRGLMHREQLEDGHGMYFEFDDDTIRRFWMHNTLIPLDMIFVDKDGVVVGVVHEAEPLTDETRFVETPSRNVLEVPGGWCRRHGVAAGAVVRVVNDGAGSRASTPPAGTRAGEPARE